MKEISPEEIIEFLENNANTLYCEILDMIREYKEEYP